MLITILCILLVGIGFFWSKLTSSPTEKVESLERFYCTMDVKLCLDGSYAGRISLIINKNI